MELGNYNYSDPLFSRFRSVCLFGQVSMQNADAAVNFVGTFRTQRPAHVAQCSADYSTAGQRRCVIKTTRVFARTQAFLFIPVDERNAKITLPGLAANSEDRRRYTNSLARR